MITTINELIAELQTLRNEYGDRILRTVTGDSQVEPYAYAGLLGGHPERGTRFGPTTITVTLEIPHIQFVPEPGSHWPGLGQVRAAQEEYRLRNGDPAEG